MTPVQIPDEARTAISLTMADAKDSLWKLQLRKENKALLQEIKAMEERREVERAESEQRLQVSAAQIAAVEARVAELERMQKEAKQEHEKFMEELAATSSFVAGNMARKFTEEKARFILDGGSHLVHSISNTLTRSPQPDRRPANPRLGRNLRVAERIPSRDDDNPFRRPAPGPIQRPQAQAGPSNGSGPSTRSKTRLEPPPKPVDAIAVPLNASRVPRLNQGTKSMKDYYNNANAVIGSSQRLQNDAQFDIDFVSSFLRGLRNEKTREKLIDELRQFHPSKVRRNGWVEVICAWDDVEDAIRRAGLLMEAEKKNTANKRQGRIMNPRVMVETDI